MAVKITRADQLFSLLVRNRDGWKCAGCGSQFSEDNRQGLDCSHFIGRANKAVRFDPDNACAHCTSCHFHFGGNPILFARWILNRIGEDRLAALVARSTRQFKFDKAMQAHITTRLQQSWHIASTSDLKEFPSPYGGEVQPIARKRAKAKAKGPKKRIANRGFDKTKTRTLAGKVKERAGHAVMR